MLGCFVLFDPTISPASYERGAARSCDCFPNIRSIVLDARTDLCLLFIGFTRIRVGKF